MISIGDYSDGTHGRRVSALNAFRREQVREHVQNETETVHSDSLGISQDQNQQNERMQHNHGGSNLSDVFQESCDTSINTVDDPSEFEMDLDELCDQELKEIAGYLEELQSGDILNEVPEPTLSDVPVEKDAETLRDFCQFMNWTFISKGQKKHWTEKEIMYFMQTEIAEMLIAPDGSLKFDGLIVCVSCHGIEDKIVTSDMKTIEKKAIHRILSLNYPKLRDIPRIFAFDCCEASDEKAVIEMSTEQSKAIQMALMEESEGRNTRTASTKNPDHDLVEVHASNAGIGDKMNYNGSYLVYCMTMAIKNSVEKKLRKTLAELLEIVQKHLPDLGRQQMINCIFNNNTRSLVFNKHANS